MSKFQALSEFISFTGKTAIITGAAAGIGAATARRFAEAGADLFLLDIDKDKLEKVKQSLSDYDVKISTYQIDLSNKTEIDKFWQSLDKQSPDMLVNNAGVYPFRDFLETDEEIVHKVMDINLYAAYWMCQHFIRRRLKVKKGGTIVNLGSIEAQLPFKDDLAHYTTSKAAVIALTRSLARDYGGKGIRANVILPGGIITEGTKSAAKQALRHPGLIKDGIKFNSRLPMGRMGQPDDIARMILVLSSAISGYMTGAVVPVDGGFLST